MMTTIERPARDRTDHTAAHRPSDRGYMEFLGGLAVNRAAELAKEELVLRRRLLFRLLAKFDFDAPKVMHEPVSDPGPAYAEISACDQFEFA